MMMCLPFRRLRDVLTEDSTDLGRPRSLGLMVSLVSSWLGNRGGVLRKPGLSPSTGMLNCCADGLGLGCCSMTKVDVGPCVLFQVLV